MQFGEPWEIKRERYRAPQGNAWQRWFAWYPIRIRLGRIVWLEEVEWRYWSGMTFDVPEYREIP